MASTSPLSLNPLPEPKPSRPCKDDLFTDGIDKLSAPGTLTNWINWSFLMETSIKASAYGYFMLSALPSLLPPTYAADKAKLCAVLTRHVSTTNLVILRRHKDDPRAMWRALQAAHEQNTAGSCLFWLEHLFSFQLTGKSILGDLNQVESIGEHLSSLINPSCPLSVDEILVMVISTSLPDDFCPMIAPLLQQSTVSAPDVLSAVREEVTRMSLASPKVSVNQASSERGRVLNRPSPSHNGKQHNPPLSSSWPYCCFCRFNGHNIASFQRLKNRSDDMSEL